jgi:hypothetical protein
MLNNPTRQEMINALTHYELQWLIDNPEFLPEVTEFFSNGGFDNVNIDDLKAVYSLKIMEEV